MYLPRNLPLCRPHVAMWIGASGKRYDFAVCRPGTIGVDEPAVYILARHDGQVTTPLFVGHTTSLHRHFGLSSRRCPEQWRRALAIGMTHVHLRFDTSSKMTREAEVRDLVAALAPTLNDQPVRDEERSVPALETAQPAAARTDRTRLYRRERAGVGGKARSPALAIVDAGRHISVERAVAPPLFRADPAREDDGEPGDFETPVAAVDTPPDMQHRPDMRPAAATFEGFEQEAEAIQLAPAMPAGTPHVGRQPNEQLTDALSPEDADVVQATTSAEPAKPTSFLARVRDLVARFSAAWRADALDGAGSGKSRSVLAAVPVVTVAPPAAPEAAALSAGTGETRDAVREDATTVPHEAAEASEDTFPAEPIAAEASAKTSAPEAVEASEDASLPEPIAAEAGPISQHEAKRGLDLDPFAPVALFAGNLSYEAGADILLDAIVTVCAGNQEVQFLFAGDGALRDELQERASRAGLDRRCRFLGHVPADSFDRVLTACDFVVIPARVRQDEDLARVAIVAGKPVVTTHQAAIPFIVHGRNGLITYDNPGSFVWAIRALLSPLCASLRRHLAETA